MFLLVLEKFRPNFRAKIWKLGPHVNSIVYMPNKELSLNPKLNIGCGKTFVTGFSPYNIENWVLEMSAKVCLMSWKLDLQLPRVLPRKSLNLSEIKGPKF